MVGCIRWSDLRLTEFDQILVCGPRVEATDVQVGLAQLLSATAAVADGGSDGVGAAAAAAAAVVRAWWSHVMVGGRHIRLLHNRLKTGSDGQ